MAIGERDGAEAGLLELEAVEGLDHYSLWHAARGELLRRAGRDDLAREAELRAAGSR